MKKIFDKNPLSMNNEEWKMQTSIFFVEANSNESFMLWKEWHNEVLWEQDNMGFSQIIGYVDELNKKPVNVSFLFALINSARICFYETISRYNDSVMVEKFIEKNYPVKWDNNSRRAMCDAGNFHLAVNAVKEWNNKRIKNIHKNNY